MKSYDEKTEFEKIESRINAVLRVYKEAEKENAFPYHDGVVKGLKIAKELIEEVKKES